MEFNALLQQAQQLSNEAGEGYDYPQVDRTIGQVLQATQELHARVTQTGTKDIQAHLLLSSRGIDLPKLTQKLDSLSARKTFEPLDPIGDTDIQSFIKNEKENAILSVVDEVNRNLYDSAQKFKWDNITAEWNNEKTQLLSSLVGPSQEFIDIQRVSEQTVLNESCAQRTQLNRIEACYAQAVIEYNEAILKGGYRPNLVQKFASVAESFNDDKINDMWSILVHMVSVPSTSRNIDPIKRRQETGQFVTYAKSYLESRYKLYMTSIVSVNLEIAERGGIPDTYSLVKGFVAVNFNANTMIGLVDVMNDKPLWPHVYYSLRSGEMETAIEFIKAFGNHHTDFVQAIHEKMKNPTQEINSKLEGQLKLLYSNKIKNTTDPFKKASFCIILGCDVHEPHSEVAKTIDDFLWIQLSILRTKDSRDSNSTEQLTYPALQSLVLEQYGENYFHASEQAHIYFQVLALTGQFEAGIEFLARLESNRSHAVHMALALNELYLLGTPRDVQSPLLCIDDDDPQPMRRLNLARLVIMYAKGFEYTDTAEALHYYSFLRNYKYSDGRNLFLTCVCDLAIETCNYKLIFGELDPSGNGKIIGGLFDQFTGLNFKTSTICAMVAEQLSSRGMLENALYLFDLAGLHDKAMKTLSVLLSQCVHQFPQPGTMRQRLAQHVEQLGVRLEAHQIIVDPHTANTFHLLRMLLIFFDLYYEGKYRAALDCLAETNLIPIRVNDVDDCIANFKRLGGEVCKVFPDVLLAAMDIIYTEYKEIKNNVGNSKNSDLSLRELRDKAKLLNNMAATIPYRMPGEVNKRLVQIEILMH